LGVCRTDGGENQQRHEKHDDALHGLSPRVKELVIFTLRAAFLGVNYEYS
jgi:hypothetical protein